MVILGTPHGKEVTGKRMLLQEEFLDDYYINHRCTEKINNQYYFAEWKSGRDIAARIKEILDADVEFNHSCEIDWMEDNEPGLKTHIKIVNNILADYVPETQAFYLALHHNAMDYGLTWHPANGISGWTLPQFDKSDLYLDIIIDTIKSEMPELPITGDKYCEGKYTAKFTVLWQIIPAILMESLFYTNKTDLKYLYDDNVREKYCQTLALAIKKIHQKYME